MKICPECNAENDPGYRFCRECGVSLERVATDPADAARGVAATLVDAPTGEQDDGKRTLAYRSDGTPRRAYLHRITASQEREEPFALESSETTIGREDGDLQLPADVFLSNPHARLFFDDGHLWVEDLNSANGTFRRIRERANLRFGDTMVVGHQALRLDSPDDILDSGDNGDDGSDHARLRTAAYGRPAAEYVACLSALLADGSIGSRYLLDSRDWVLGRERGDIVFARDDYISNDHLVIRYSEGSHEVEDLGSENGTYLRIGEATKLDDGDSVMLGRQVFIVRFE